ncbi:MAG: recombination regulator RecX [Firmicutes bacterium]|nr:recombination regulator RecX [Bacillota bacterium]
MNKVTKIEQQKNNKERVNIYINNEFFIGTSKEIVFNLKIKKDSTVDKDKLKDLIEEETFFKAKNKAYQILNMAMQSESILRDKLLKKGYEDYIIDRVITHLKKYSFINDEEMARSITRDKKNIKKYGKKRIRYNLKNKKIDKQIIDRVLNEEVDSEDEFENALYFAKKKYRKIKDTDKRKIYQKLARYLAYRGFDYNIIKKAIKEVMGYENEEY